METWKDIKGYEGLYKISNLGRIKSLDRKTPIFRRGVTHYRHIPEIIMKTIISKETGYYYVFLSSIGRKNYTVHRLLAEAFIPNPNNKPQVNHKNGIKSDNRLENLEWVTISENQTHAYNTGLKNYSLEGNPRRIVIDTQTGIFWSTKEVANLINRSYSNTLAILSGSRKNKTSYRYA